jgi:hypothetical protein
MGEWEQGETTNCPSWHGQRLMNWGLAKSRVHAAAKGYVAIKANQSKTNG